MMETGSRLPRLPYSRLDQDDQRARENGVAHSENQRDGRLDNAASSSSSPSRQDSNGVVSNANALLLPKDAKDDVERTLLNGSLHSRHSYSPDRKSSSSRDTSGEI